MKIDEQRAYEYARKDFIKSMKEHGERKAACVIALKFCQDMSNKIQSDGWKMRTEAEKYAPKPKFEFIATTGVVDTDDQKFYFDKVPRGAEWIRFTAKYLNKEEVDEFWKPLEGDNRFNKREEGTSLTYYRMKTNPNDTSGILLGQGSGWLDLSAPATCSDDDWKLLTSGIIPDHLKYNKEKRS